MRRNFCEFLNKKENPCGLSFLKLDDDGITLTHLSNEHPDEPEPSCDEGQGTIDDELSESVIHNYSLNRFHYMRGNLCEKLKPVLRGLSL